MTTPTRRLAAWLACIAILFAALAPSVSRAMAARDGGMWAEICSVAGIKFVKLAADAPGQADPAKDAAGHVKHCAFCSTHAGPLALLPVSFSILPSVQTPALYPRLFFSAPRPLAIWAAPQSRAPPAIA